MDQFTRRIIGSGIHRGTVDGPSPSSMFQRSLQGQALPKYLSTDNDPVMSENSIALKTHGLWGRA